MRDLGFDYAFNYKKEDLSETLNKAAPGGIDVYYDDVSRPILSIVMIVFSLILIVQEPGT